MAPAIPGQAFEKAGAGFEFKAGSSELTFRLCLAGADKLKLEL